MFAPIVRSIEVSCSQQNAFNLFLEGMNSWWPLGKFTVSAMTGKPAKELRVEPKVGGKIVEITHDAQEYLWGSVKTYQPFDYLSLDFHIPLPDEKVADRSLVEVRFTPLGEKRTRVVLTQSNWEAFGKRAAMLHGGYGKGWAIIFDGAFKAACGNAAMNSRGS